MQQVNFVQEVQFVVSLDLRELLHNFAKTWLQVWQSFLDLFYNSYYKI